MENIPPPTKTPLHKALAYEKISVPDKQPTRRAAHISELLRASSRLCLPTLSNLCMQQAISRLASYITASCGDLARLDPLCSSQESLQCNSTGKPQLRIYTQTHTHTRLWNKPPPLSRRREGLNPKEEWFKFLNPYKNTERDPVMSAL